jgi:chorismate synthase
MHAAAASLRQEEIQFELDRRRPGQSKITTPRKETDTCEILSGMAPDGLTTLGTPICVLVRRRRRGTPPLVARRHKAPLLRAGHAG